MKELRLVIVDDEELAIQNLEEQIEAINGPYRIVGTARNGVQAWELLQKVKPDVAFIDIKNASSDRVGTGKENQR